MLKFASGLVFLVAIPMIAGAWLLGTPDQIAGEVTIFMGVVLAVFLVSVLMSSPPGAAGWNQPSPD